MHSSPASRASSRSTGYAGQGTFAYLAVVALEAGGRDRATVPNRNLDAPSAGGTSAIRSTLNYVATPVDTGSERLTDRALAITDDLLGATERLVQRLHRTVHERRVLHDARRGVLGEPRDGDYIRNYADKLRKS